MKALLLTALVWLPPAGFRDWDRLDAALRAHPELKLTVGLTPALAASGREALKPLISAGRVEIAARAPGDPPLALTAAHPLAPRPDDALEIASAARMNVEKALGFSVPGFIPGTGALDLSLISPLGASGAAWILSGPYAAAGSSWAAAGSAVFVPAKAAPPVLNAAAFGAEGALVIDESSGGDSFLTALSALSADARPAGEWTTISQLVRSSAEARSNAEAVASWPGWDGAPAAPPVDPASRAAWNAYGAAAQAVTLYQNSGSANLRVLERAGALLRQSAEARFFLPAPAGAEPSPAAELRARLLAVYKEIKSPAPDSLFALATPGMGASPSEAPSGVRVSSGTSWIAFDNPLASTASVPSGAGDAEAWRLRSLRVAWDEGHLIFQISPGRVEISTQLPRPLYDLYVDINHVAGAGSIDLLEGRSAFVPPRDAWEYALTLSGSDARLWRATSEGPEELAILAVEADVSSGTLHVSVPRSLLRGNPARWGYLAVSLAEDPARPGRSPAAPLTGPQGTPILGVLAPLEIQQSLLENRPGARRMPAVRVEE